MPGSLVASGTAAVTVISGARRTTDRRGLLGRVAQCGPPARRNASSSPSVPPVHEQRRDAQRERSHRPAARLLGEQPAPHLDLRPDRPPDLRVPPDGPPALADRVVQGGAGTARPPVHHTTTVWAEAWTMPRLAACGSHGRAIPPPAGRPRSGRGGGGDAQDRLDPAGRRSRPPRGHARAAARRRPRPPGPTASSSCAGSRAAPLIRPIRAGPCRPIVWRGAHRRVRGGAPLG